MIWTLTLSFGLLYLTYRCIGGTRKFINLRDEFKAKMNDPACMTPENLVLLQKEYRLCEKVYTLTPKNMLRELKFNVYFAYALLAILLYFAFSFFPIPAESFKMSACEQAYVEKEIKGGDIFHYRMLKKARAECTK